MTIVDANVLIYAVNSAEPNHEAARRWLDEQLSGRAPVGFAWISLLAYLRLATHPAVFPRPLGGERALEIAESWLSQPPAVVVHPTHRHLALLRGLLGPVGTASNLVNDAHLAALAIEHGASIATFDRDFDRFPGVRRVTPPS